MVQKSAQHLLTLINDVLDLSKIEAGQLKVARKEFVVQEAVAAAVGTVKPLAEKKGLRLISRVDQGIGTVVSDRRRVEQIIINLVNNAVKFTREGEVEVTAVLGDGVVEFRVRDTGVGIKPQDMDKLFQNFQQIDTGLDRQVEGSGLGLSICRKLVRLLGGEISVESIWGEGSTFTFTLPRRAPEA